MPARAPPLNRKSLTKSMGGTTSPAWITGIACITGRDRGSLLFGGPHDSAASDPDALAPISPALGETAADPPDRCAQE
jgi:hypothetical protein